MFSKVFWTLCAYIFVSIAHCAEVVTTTLNSLEERSVAVLDQESFIRTVMLDAATDIGRYSSVMYSENIEIPQKLLQFIVQINKYDVSAFPTSIFIQSFPFEDFGTFITHFPWMTSYMSACSITQFKVPSEYAVFTTTVEADVASVAATPATPTDTLSIVPSTTTPAIASSTSSVSSSSPSSSSSSSRAKRSSSVSEFTKLSTLLSSSLGQKSNSSSKGTVSVSTANSSAVPYHISSSSHDAAATVVPSTLLLFFFFLPLLI